MRRTSGVGASGFALPAEEAQAAGHAQSISQVSTVSAVMALQLDGAGARRRQTRRAAAQLDALDRMQAALLAPGDGQDLAGLARDLETGLRGRELTGDAGLDAVLNDIDVRAAVELAKRTRSGAPHA